MPAQLFFVVQLRIKIDEIDSAISSHTALLVSGSHKAGNARREGWRATFPATRESSSGNNLLRAPFPGCVPFGHGFCSPSIASPRKSQQQTALASRGSAPIGRFIPAEPARWSRRGVAWSGSKHCEKSTVGHSTCYVSTHRCFEVASCRGLSSCKLHKHNRLIGIRNWPTECTLQAGSGLNYSGTPALSPKRGIRRKDQEIEAMMKNSARQFSKHGNETRGFTLIEALVVLAVTAILMAIAITQFQRITQALRISGDMRDITGTVGQAKMHAASDFTHGRARANLVANTFPANTFQLAI